MEYKAWLDEFFTGLGVDVMRYFLFAGIPFLLLYILFKSKMLRFKVQQKFPENKQLAREIGYSLLSMVIFSVVSLAVFVLQQQGYTKIYMDIHQHSTTYLVASVFIFIIAHDTWFYWTHRLMHHKKIYPHVHLIHHKSINPSPWATFAFHPYEAFIQVLILPVMVFAIPLHPAAILAWSMYQLVLNVGGHTGYEFFRSGFTKRFHTLWSNTATHHNLHHKYVNCNYSLYFNVWDRIMGTNHARYHDEFEAVIERRTKAKNETPKTETKPVTTDVPNEQLSAN